MKNLLKVAIALAILFAVSLVLLNVAYPKVLAKQDQLSGYAFRTEEGKSYTHGQWRISFIEGTLVTSSDQRHQNKLYYTDFLCPNMAICGNFIAIFESAATHFYLLNLGDATFRKIESGFPLSSVRLSAGGNALVITHSGSEVYMFDQMGTLKFQLKINLLLCDAAISQNGKRVGLLFFSEKKGNGYLAEIYSVESGKRISYANLIYDDIPTCFMHGNRLCLKKDDQAIGFFWLDKFYLFPQNT